jgi:hypothetical protein
VIRGGAYSAGDLDAALRSDPVAAVHYASFDRARTQVVQAAEPSAVYVSYRQNNRIYWTRHTVRIPEGELLLSDGVSLARARCGNRLSLSPQEPVQADEPAPADFDIAQPPLPADGPGSADTPAPPPLVVHEVFPPAALPALPSTAADGGTAPVVARYVPVERPGIDRAPLPEWTFPGSVTGGGPTEFQPIPPPGSNAFAWTPPPSPVPGAGANSGSASTTGSGGSGGNPATTGPPPSWTILPGTTTTGSSGSGSHSGAISPGSTTGTVSPIEPGNPTPSPPGSTLSAEDLFPPDSRPPATEVPEPATAALLVCAAIAVAFRRVSSGGPG